MIHPSQAKFETQRELLEFMNDHDISVRLAANLLSISESTVHFYRRGARPKKPVEMPKELLQSLKIRYKEYKMDKIQSIK